MLTDRQNKIYRQIEALTLPTSAVQNTERKALLKAEAAIRAGHDFHETMDELSRALIFIAGLSPKVKSLFNEITAIYGRPDALDEYSNHLAELDGAVVDTDTDHLRERFAYFDSTYSKENDFSQEEKIERQAQGKFVDHEKRSPIILYGILGVIVTVLLMVFVLIILPALLPQSLQNDKDQELIVGGALLIIMLVLVYTGRIKRKK